MNYTLDEISDLLKCTESKYHRVKCQIQWVNVGQNGEWRICNIVCTECVTLGQKRPLPLRHHVYSVLEYLKFVFGFLPQTNLSKFNHSFRDVAHRRIDETLFIAELLWGRRPAREEARTHEIYQVNTTGVLLCERVCVRTSQHTLWKSLTSHFKGTSCKYRFTDMWLYLVIQKNAPNLRFAARFRGEKLRKTSGARVQHHTLGVVASNIMHVPFVSFSFSYRCLLLIVFLGAPLLGAPSSY